MKIKEVAEALERFAPLPLQEDYDNAGLQIGLTESDVSGALLCLDVTEDVIREAASHGCNLIVAHHPLLFRGLKCISDVDYVQRCVREAILAGIRIYAAHTNLDNALGGVNFAMASRMGLTNVSFLAPATEGGSGIIGDLPLSLSAPEFLELLKSTFQTSRVRHNGFARSIRRVALCGGAGEFLIDEALKSEADAFVTGEIGYHRFFGLKESIMLAALGHYESEQYTIELLESILKKECPGLRTLKTTTNTNPIHYY